MNNKLNYSSFRVSCLLSHISSPVVYIHFLLLIVCFNKKIHNHLSPWSRGRFPVGTWVIMSLASALSPLRRFRSEQPTSSCLIDPSPRTSEMPPGARPLHPRKNGGCDRVCEPFLPSVLRFQFLRNNLSPFLIPVGLVSWMLYPSGVVFRNEDAWERRKGWSHVFRRRMEPERMGERLLCTCWPIGNWPCPSLILLFLFVLEQSY